MPAITQTLNTNAVWNGTVPGSADTTITHFRLYSSSTVDQSSNFRLVKQVPNPGAGPIVLGPLTYPELYLNVPTRSFFLRATRVQSGKETDLTNAAESPSLAVTPSAIVGWSLNQLLEQDPRPVILVGYDPVNKLFYPLKVVFDVDGYKIVT